MDRNALDLIHFCIQSFQNLPLSCINGGHFPNGRKSGPSRWCSGLLPTYRYSNRTISFDYYIQLLGNETKNDLLHGQDIQHYHYVQFSWFLMVNIKQIYILSGVYLEAYPVYLLSYRDLLCHMITCTHSIEPSLFSPPPFCCLSFLLLSR